MNRVIFHLILFSQINSGKRTGIYYIDSTCLPVCLLKRSKRHKTFDEIAQYGRTSVGWFFGLKLHLVINDHGELIAFKITSGKQHDVKASESILESLKGLAFGDKFELGSPASVAAARQRALDAGLFPAPSQQAVTQATSADAKALDSPNP